MSSRSAVTANEGSVTIRAGVDIGGTFTDVALECGTMLYSAKVLTDYAQPERAIVEAMRRATAQAGIAMSQVQAIVHGTTLATNALIERRGAYTAFITSDGFRDVIEMRTESRFDQYDLGITLPKPLVPRQDRLTLRGRMSASGAELVPLDEKQLDGIIGHIRHAGYESVAVGLMHSYINPAHERRVRERLLEAMPSLAVSLSCEVSPQIREYERFNTVCANAFVLPLMSSYLNRLAGSLREAGVDCPIYMIHSGGGLMSLRSAAALPVRLLESGPAGGAIYASHVAARFGLGRVLSFDMGGTTAKICLIEQQRPKTARTFEVARTYRFKKGSGMPISIPVIEMVEIGAGGGSIAHVDELRQVRVGPESAGSEPGPACYGRGGERPTVTDADLLLGKLDPARFAGGSMRLFADAARVAVDEHIVRMSHHLTADTAGEEASSHTPENRIVDAAFALAEVVDENMANAARVHAVENGCELDTYTMIAYGGAAPLHAGRICEKLGIRQFLVPPGAGVGSAIGFLRAPFGYESLRSNVMRLDRFDADAVNALIEDMAAEVTAFVRETGYEGPAHRTLRAYMRYAGQGWEIPVDVSVERFVGDDVPALRESFEKAYLTLFGHTVARLDAEVVSWALQLRTDVAEPERMSIAKGNPSGLSRESQPVERRLVFDAQSGRFHDCALYDREGLQVGERLAGPAIIAERETSTLVPPRFSVILQHDGCLLVDRNEGVA